MSVMNWKVLQLKKERIKLFVVNLKPFNITRVSEKWWQLDNYLVFTQNVLFLSIKIIHGLKHYNKILIHKNNFVKNGNGIYNFFLKWSNSAYLTFLYWDLSRYKQINNSPGSVMYIQNIYERLEEDLSQSIVSLLKINNFIKPTNPNINSIVQTWP